MNGTESRAFGLTFWATSRVIPGVLESDQLEGTAERPRRNKRVIDGGSLLRAQPSKSSSQSVDDVLGTDRCRLSGLTVRGAGARVSTEHGPSYAGAQSDAHHRPGGDAL
jgi:hypothetical protein